MAMRLEGVVQGQTVRLDHKIERLEGQRVLVVLEPLEEPLLSATETAEMWQAWVAKGPDGPIEDDDPAFP